MAAQDVQTEILEPMQRIFQPPWKMGDGEQANALREYVSALQYFDATDLNVAWCAVRDTHTTRGWPVPATFVAAARANRKNRIEEAKAAKPVQRQGENANWEAWKAATRTAKAREAVKMNVAWALKCAVLHDGKPLGTVDLMDLVIAKRSAEIVAEKIERRDPIPYKGRMLVFSDDNAEIALRLWRGCMINEEQTKSEIMRVAA